MSSSADVAGLESTGATSDRFGEVSTPTALELVALLHDEEEVTAMAGGCGDASASGRWDHARAPSTGMAPGDEHSDPTLPVYERMP